MPSWPLAATAFTLSCAAFSSLRELRVQGEMVSASLDAAAGSAFGICIISTQSSADSW